MLVITSWVYIINYKICLVSNKNSHSITKMINAATCLCTVSAILFIGPKSQIVVAY